MLVVHIDSIPDCERFSLIWEGLSNVTVLSNPRSKSAVEDAIRNEEELIILCGHGSPGGLFNCAWNGYIVDERTVQFLRNKKVMACWCYSSEFADKYNLHGFFTSMFISNTEEATKHGFPDATEDEIYQWNCEFARYINNLIKEDVPMNEWVERIQRDLPMTGVCGYNYEALSYFE